MLKDAFERKLFDDSRTYGYLSYALADKYTELADYVEETIIPACGKAMIPFLLSGFRLEDKTEHVRRLRLLHQLGYEGIDALIDKIFAENLPNLQAEAVIILSDKKDEKTEDFIISLASDKNKVVRGAAYKALAKLGTQRSIDKLYELYSNNKQKGNAELLANAIATVPLPSHYQSFVQKVREYFEALLAMDDSDEKAVVAAFERLPIELEVLKYKDYPETYALLGEMFGNKLFNVMAKKRSLTNYHIIPRLVDVLDTFKQEKIISFYEQYTDTLVHSDWAYPLFTDYFYRILNGEVEYSKEKIYEIFAPQFGKVLAPYDAIEGLAGTKGIYYAVGFFYKKLHPITADKIDSRWADLFYNYLLNLKKYDDNYSLEALKVLSVLEKNSFRLNELVLKILPKVPTYRQEFMYRFIMKSNIPDKFEVLYESIAKIPKGYHYYYNNIIEDENFWKSFPKEYAKKFRELYEKTKNDLFENIADQIEKSL